MKKLLLLIVFSIPFLGFAQLPVVPSKMYSWKEPTDKRENNIVSAVLFEGSAYDMEYLQMSANAITPAKKKVSLQIPDNEEHLLIVKTGILTIGFKDSTWSIGGGSVALLMPGEKYALQNKTSDRLYFLPNEISLKITDGPGAGTSVRRIFCKRLE